MNHMDPENSEQELRGLCSGLCVRTAWVPVTALMTEPDSSHSMWYQSGMALSHRIGV